MPSGFGKEAFSELNERERDILHAVVHSYITSAEPVGSRAVVRRFAIDLSAATVRNVMADLEELGFLQQVHTSSGRVPTDAGYRYYINHLMKVQELTLSERRRIDNALRERMHDMDAILRHTSHLLALVSHQAGVVQRPDVIQARLQRFELVPLSESRMAVLIVDNYGNVRSVTASLSRPMDARKIESLNNFLNASFFGERLETLADSIRLKLAETVDESRELTRTTLEVLDMLPGRQEQRLFLEGASRLFEQPEFQRVEQAREVFGLLEEQDRLVALLRQAVNEGEGGAVLIGSRDRKSGIDDIGVVASTYSVDGKPAGLIGVVGPRRMPYFKLTAVVQYTANLVGRLLTRLGK